MTRMPPMKSLAENFVHLSGLRYWMSPEESAAAPAGRLAALEDFGSDPGELGAHYHIPASCPPRAPLVGGPASLHSIGRRVRSPCGLVALGG